MKKILFLFGVILIINNACKKETANNTLPLNQSVELKKGLNMSNTVEGISIKLDSVVIDSRCPSDVVCVWEGNAEANFTCYTSAANRISFVLNTHGSYITDTLVFGYRIKLLDLKPYPISTIHIDPDKYTAEILITKE